MTAAQILRLIADLIGKLGPLAAQAVEAERASDQAALDAVHDRVVALSNAMAPPGADVVAVR